MINVGAVTTIEQLKKEVQEQYERLGDRDPAGLKPKSYIVETARGIDEQLVGVGFTQDEGTLFFFNELSANEFELTSIMANKSTGKCWPKVYPPKTS